MIKILQTKDEEVVNEKILLTDENKPTVFGIAMVGVAFLSVLGFLRTTFTSLKIFYILHKHKKKRKH